MSLALDEAWKYQLLTYPNPAVGALLLDKHGKILALTAHKKAGTPHAEVLAFKQGYFALTQDSEILPLEDSAEIHDYLTKNHNGIFTECELYVSLEPCNSYGKTPPCSKLIQTLRPKKLFIGSKDVGNGGMRAIQESGITVETGVLQKECDDLLEPFLLWSEKRFVFFKIAQRLDGSIDGGTITSLESLRYVHEIRDRLDLLIIGGNTVRTDRPKLDARYCEGRAPNVCIYSKSKDFDLNIPLFEVVNRDVTIASTIHLSPSQKLVMIEGGEGMINATKNLVSWDLTFIAPTRAAGKNVSANITGEIVHIRKIGRDIAVFSRRGIDN